MLERTRQPAKERNTGRKTPPPRAYFSPAPQSLGWLTTPLFARPWTQVCRRWPTGGPPLFNTSQGPALEGESRKGPPLGAPPTLRGRRGTTGRNEAARQGMERRQGTERRQGKLAGRWAVPPAPQSLGRANHAPVFARPWDPRYVGGGLPGDPPFSTPARDQPWKVNQGKGPLSAHPPPYEGGEELLGGTRQPGKERNAGRKSPPGLKAPVSLIRPNTSRSHALFKGVGLLGNWVPQAKNSGYMDHTR